MYFRLEMSLGHNPRENRGGNDPEEVLKARFFELFPPGRSTLWFLTEKTGESKYLLALGSLTLNQPDLLFASRRSHQAGLFTRPKNVQNRTISLLGRAAADAFNAFHIGQDWKGSG